MKTRNEQYEMPIYELMRDIPLVNAGALFYYDENDKVKGSVGAGCLKLAWSIDGNCQNTLCADTIIFHANARRDPSWFKRVYLKSNNSYIESPIIYNGETLYRRILNRSQHSDIKDEK